MTPIPAPAPITRPVRAPVRARGHSIEHAQAGDYELRRFRGGPVEVYCKGEFLCYASDMGLSETEMI